LVAKAGFSPLVLTAWGTDLNLTRDPSHDPNLLRRKAEVIAKAALLIADSEDMIEIANDLAMSSVPSMLLPIGIDTGLFKPGKKAEALKRRRELDIPEAAKVVLSPRAFREDYGHDTIVRAFARAIRNANTDAYLVFKAYDCWDRTYIDKITNIALEYEISDRVRVIEEMPYEQLPIYYAMGDFAINFPVRDAFPVTFMECLACELPVLTKHLPAYDSLGIAPYLRFTDAPCERSLEIGISTMLFSVRSSVPNMSQARAYVCAHFDESVVAKSLADAYYRILNTGEKIS
jgi:glycosyltransferase involved in cell wall biosynthesis